MKLFFQQNKVRSLLRLSSAFIVAVIINYYFAVTPYYLLPLTTLYVMQTAIGNAFYHGMRRASLLVILAAVSALFVVSLPFFYRLLHDISLGALIGISTQLLLLPRQPEQAFREALVPLLQNYQNYFSGLLQQIRQKNLSGLKNELLEQQLLQWPVWVHERGFKRNLQPGYQFFLMKLEQMSEILFALHHLTRLAWVTEYGEVLASSLQQCEESVQQFFAGLIMLIKLENLTNPLPDLESVVTALEKETYSIVPAHLELLDLRRDYIYLAEWNYCVKDFCKLLLKLAEALRKS